MQKSVDNTPYHRLHYISARCVRSGSHKKTVEFPLTYFRELLSHLPYQWANISRTDPCHKISDIFPNDLHRLYNVVFAGFTIFFRCLRKLIDTVKINAFNFIYRWFKVSGNGNIEYK